MAKRKKYKQRSTKHTHKTKDRVTRTSVKPGGELRCFGRVSSSCATSGTNDAVITTQRKWLLYPKWIFLIEKYTTVNNEP